MGNKKTSDSVLSPKEKLRQQLEVIKSSTSTHARITKLDQRDRIELSFAQRRLWFLNQYAGGEDVTYNIPLALRLRGDLDTAALARALNTLVERHESLRTYFQQLPDQTEPEQVITEAPDFEMPVVTVEAEEAQEHIEANSRHVFNLSTGPLFRASLLHISGQENVLLICMHHIISDAWSLGILTRELSTLYQAYQQGKDDPLSALPIQYADYAHWQREWLQGEQLTRQLEYWREQLTGAPPLLDLPLNHPRPAIQTFNGAVEVFQIDKKKSKKLTALSQGEEVTLFMLLLAVFNVLLWRYSGQDEIVVGTPVANRNHSELEGLIGFFVNTLVLRHHLKSEISFRDFLNQVRQTTLGAYSHQDLPFENLVEALKPERSASYSPLFQVMFQLHNQLRGESRFALPEVEISPAAQPQEISKFDLTLSINETEEGLMGSIEYNTDLFDQPTIARMTGHFQQLVQGIVANPDQTLSALPLLTPKERHQIVHEWNDTASEYPREKCVHQLFEEQVARTPEKIAVVYEKEKLTFDELNSRANQLARYLISRGVNSGTLVGICVDRSLEMIIGLLGIIKAGGAYVPLDPSYPNARLECMLEDSDVMYLLSQSHLGSIVSGYDGGVINLDTDWHMIESELTVNPRCTIQPDSLIYVIYTSGSTGNPKGSAVKHSNVVNLYHWYQKTFLQANSRTIVCSALGFDLTQKNIWSSLLASSLVVVPGGRGNEIDEFISAIDKSKVTILNCAPSLLYGLIFERKNWPILRSLKFIILGGDYIEKQKLDEWWDSDFCSAEIINSYGPTECSDVVSIYKLKKSDIRVPIGKAINNIKLYLCNAKMELVPIGVVGEMHIGGACLGAGYIGAPTLTAQKFIENPFDDGEYNRLYKTGDLCRYLQDGNIEFVSRNDDQIKIRGYRIESEEIRSELIKHASVKQCLILNKENRLIAFYIEETPIDTTSLKAYLSEALPNYMIPTSFILLNEFPLTANGKIDKDKLLNIEIPLLHSKQHISPPETEIELKLASIWSNLLNLNLEHIGVIEDFFDIGGTSLSLLYLKGKVESEFMVEIGVSQLYQNRTIRSLSKKIQKALAVGYTRCGPIATDGHEFPCLASLKQSKIFLWKLNKNPNLELHPCMSFSLSHDVNYKALDKAFRAVVEKNPVLRSSFRCKNSEVFVYANNLDDYRLEVRYLNSIKIIRNEIKEWSKEPFNYREGGPLIEMKLRVCASNDRQTILSIKVDHLIFDGYSWGPFLNQFFNAYLNSKDGATDLGGVDNSYYKYAEYERRRISRCKTEIAALWEVNFKSAVNNSIVQKLSPSVARPRNPQNIESQQSFSFRLHQKHTKAEKYFLKNHGVPGQVFYFTAFQKALSLISNFDDLQIKVVFAGRRFHEYRKSIGFYSNVMMLPVTGGLHKPFDKCLINNSALFSKAIDTQELFSMSLADGMSDYPNYTKNKTVDDIVFKIDDFYNDISGEIDKGGVLKVEPFSSNSIVGKCDLEFSLAQIANDMRITIIFDFSIFNRSFIHQLKDGFKAVLAEASKEIA